MNAKLTFPCPACNEEMNHHKERNEDDVEYDVFVCNTDKCPVFSLTKFVNSSDKELSEKLAQ
jgi:hypothetical protein